MGRLALSRARSSRRAPQSAKSLFGAFLFDSFFFCACICKRKSGMEQIFFVLAVDYTWFLSCRGRRLRRPAKRHKETFFIVLFTDEKYQKSAKRAFPSLCKLTPRARVSRTSHAWQVRAANGKAEVDNVILSATSYYHACEHITRRSRADSCTHCLHAR